MLLSLWPLIEMENILAVDTPEVTTLQEVIELVVVSVDEGEMITKET